PRALQLCRRPDLRYTPTQTRPCGVYSAAEGIRRLTPLIRVENVYKRFAAHTVLDGLSFTVGEGEIVGLLGPNGSGKTTTVRLLNGVLRADGGSLAVAGLDPVSEGDRVRAMSGILTETARFYGHLTGRENLRFFAALYGVTDPRRPDALLDMFGLREAADRRVGTYSTGMRKRLGLAKALLHQPRILFLDEPTNDLDPEGTRLVLEHIRELNRREGTTVLLCSHLLEQLEKICHRYVFIDRGRCIAAGDFASLQAQYLPEVILEVETDLPLDAAAARGVPAVPVDAEATSGARRIQFTLPDREAAARFLRDLTQEANVYAAMPVRRDLESLYFRIREVHGT
ncbi:MAG TPA: ABC transporter ATP-binding protein, partial [Limnochordia bacterium]